MTHPALVGVSMGGSLLSGLLNASAQKRAGQSNSAMYNYQASVAELNAKISKQNADRARQTGEREAGQFSRGARERLGQITAAQGASGIDIASGSSVAVRDSQHKIAMMDMTQIRENAAKIAYNYDTESKQLEDQARLYKMAAADSANAGRMNFFTSILSSASSVSSEWLRARQYGML